MPLTGTNWTSEWNKYIAPVEIKPTLPDAELSDRNRKEMIVEHDDDGKGEYSWGYVLDSWGYVLVGIGCALGLGLPCCILALLWCGGAANYCGWR